MQSKQSQEQMAHRQNPGQKKILKVKDEFAYKGQEGKNRTILKSVRSNFESVRGEKELRYNSFLCPGGQEHVAHSSMV